MVRPMSTRQVDPSPHATWAASSTARNWACSGALALGAKIPEPPTNFAAAWGTACHTVSEESLRNKTDPNVFLDEVLEVETHKIEVDEELVETAREYIDYVRDRLAAYKAETGLDDAVLYVEQYFSLKKLNPPFDAGGTGDAVLWFPAWRLLEVVDLKGGRGVVVEAHGNKQARTYGLGSVLTNPGLDIERVMSTIVQPRAGHKDGRIRSETYHVADLMEWTSELVARMARAKRASDEYEKITGDVSREAWGDEFLEAGEHCRFCKAMAICPAIEKKAMASAGLWFDDLDQPKLKNTPDELDPVKLAQKLDAADLVQDFFNACRAMAHRMADSGVEIPGYQLVEKIGNRKWKGEDDQIRENLFLKLDLTDDEIFARKLRSPAQIEKVLGAKRKNLIADLVHREVTGTNLVRVDKTTRPAVAAAVNKHFTPID